MKRFKILTALTLLSTAGLSHVATAGTLQEPTVEAPLIIPEAVTPIGEWTGFYTGLQLGYADISGDGGLDGNDTSYGFHVGYDYDFGDFVIGGELDYDKTDVSLGTAGPNIDSIARLKVKGGYDLGNTLVYATAGAARADTSVGTETGPFLGLGVNYKITDRYTVGAELLQHRFDDVGGVTGSDLDATTFNVRATLRF